MVHVSIVHMEIDVRHAVQRDQNRHQAREDERDDQAQEDEPGEGAGVGRKHALPSRLDQCLFGHRPYELRQARQ